MHVNSEHGSPDSAFKESDGIGVSQRYSDAKTMTYLYLFLYRLATEPLFYISGEYIQLVTKLDIKNRIEKSNTDLFSDDAFVQEFNRRL